MNDRTAELAAVTPGQITDFVLEIVESGRDRPPASTTILIYPTARARVLGLAKRSVEAVLAWDQTGKRAKHLSPIVELIGRVMKQAFVDATDDTVAFTFSASDMSTLATAVPVLIEFEVVRENDSKSRSSGGYRKGRS